MKQPLTQEMIALRASKELKDGYYVNIGMGMPLLILNLPHPEGVEVMYHSENGILGFGHVASEDEWDPDLDAAGTVPVVSKPGCSFFSQAEAFAMMRGGHLDLAIMGGYQVSEKGDLANWMIPGQRIGGIGGAMDLAYGAKRIIVIMGHTDKSGRPRIVKECSYPLTGKGIVNTIITNVALIEVTPQGLLLKEVVEGFTAEDVQAITEPKLMVSDNLKEMEF